MREWTRLGMNSFGSLFDLPTIRFANWGRVLASPRIFAYSPAGEYSAIIRQNHDFCRFFQENSKKSRQKSRKIGNFMTKFEKILQKLCSLANNCRIFASWTVGEYSAISNPIIASPWIVFWRLFTTNNRHYSAIITICSKSGVDERVDKRMTSAVPATVQSI